MPALATERDLVELASRLRLWDEQMSAVEHPDRDASGQMTGQVDLTDRIVRFGDGPPEEALSAHLPRMLAASRKAVAAGTPVVVTSECTMVPPVLAAVRERHPDVALVWIDAHGDLNTPGRLRAASSAACRSPNCSAGASTTGAGSRASSRRYRRSARCSWAVATSIRASARTWIARRSTSPMTPPERWPRCPRTRRSTCTSTRTCSTHRSRRTRAFPHPEAGVSSACAPRWQRSDRAVVVVAVSICPSAPPALDAEGLAPLVDALTGRPTASRDQRVAADGE